MQNDKTLVLNRFLLIGILFVSAVIPLLNFQFFQPEVPVKQVEIIREFVSAPLFFAQEIPVAEFSVSQPVKNEINYWLLIYGAIIFILIIRLFIAVVKVLQLIRKAEKQKLKNIVLAVVKEMIQPFTFLNHVVLSEKDLNENKKIIVAHEQAHIKQLHAIDLAVCEVFTLLHFFNPLMWLLRHDLKLIHEYQADQAVLNKGIDAQQYQLLVIQKAVGERRFALANNFSQKPILKRIKMMKKNKKRWTQIKLLLFVPILLLLLQAFAINNSFSSKTDFLIAELQDSLKLWTKNWNYSNLNDIGQKVTSLKVTDENEEYEKSPPINWSNVLGILINKDNKLIINREFTEFDKFDEVVVDFINGKQSDGRKINTLKKDIPYFGEMDVPQGVILFRVDLYSSHFTVQEITEKIGRIYLNLRDQKSISKFNQSYLLLNEDKRKAIDELIPIRITTGEPKLDKEKQQVVFINK
jgi:beta-lactamase regulating signal transducer with metallopeptidase domain